jgi:hypothetical protein
MGLQPQSCNLFNLGEHMYKITIDLSEWGTDDEVLTIETFDFDKIEIIKEFIEFQQAHGWAVDYDVVVEEDEEDEEEDDNYFYDVEGETWYKYDEENDEWVEVEDEDEEDEEEEESEEAAGDTYIFNITTTDEK